MKTDWYKTITRVQNVQVGGDDIWFGFWFLLLTCKKGKEETVVCPKHSIELFCSVFTFYWLLYDDYVHRNTVFHALHNSWTLSLLLWKPDHHHHNFVLTVCYKCMVAKDFSIPISQKKNNGKMTKYSQNKVTVKGLKHQKRCLKNNRKRLTTRKTLKKPRTNYGNRKVNKENSNKHWESYENA